MIPGQVSSFLVTFMRVVGSTVVGKHNAVLVGGYGGVGGFDDPDDVDEQGERMEDAEAYGTIGVVFRPRPPIRIPSPGDPPLSPSELATADLVAEAMALKVGGKLTPVAWRDLRLNRRFPAPKAGSIALVGYGGGFLSFDDADDPAAPAPPLPPPGQLSPPPEKATRATWYVPYAFNPTTGVPTKAHVITLDPEAESLMLIHGDGLALTMDPDNGITMRADATTWMNMKAGETTIASAKIILQGNVVVGANPAGALPLLPGVASPPCPSLFLSPV